jgi:CheY-like chemotaxis protein
MTSAILILLAEDETLLQMPAEDALRAGGFDVLLANDGEEAIRTLNESVDQISGLITDVRMGEGPSGWDVARHARALKPQLPVVYATGQTADEWAAEGVPHSILVQKPFADAQLITAISGLLNDRS